jgi:putative membrane protein
MLTDLLLAIAHHLLMFALLGLLATEMMMLRPGLASDRIIRLSRLDLAYGIVAGLILVVGFSRVFFGIKDPWFYLANPVFWAKIGAFALVGLISIAPTRRILHWRKAVAADATFSPAESEMARVKLLMHYEGAAFLSIPVFAALMARGYGL